MRTTLTIDDDIFAAVRSIATSRSASIGSVLSELVRKGLESGNQLQSRNGLPVFAVSPGAKPITPEDVRRAEDEP